MSDALRINQTAEAQMNAQLTNQNNQIEKLSSQIEQASDQEISALLRNNQIQGSFSSTTEAKKQLITLIQEKKQTNRKELTANLKNTQLNLFKSTFKWVIGAIIAGISFVSIWRYTDWTRNIKI